MGANARPPVERPAHGGKTSALRVMTLAWKKAPPPPQRFERGPRLQRQLGLSELNASRALPEFSSDKKWKFRRFGVYVAPDGFTIAGSDRRGGGSSFGLCLDDII